MNRSGIEGLYLASQWFYMTKIQLTAHWIGKGQCVSPQLKKIMECPFLLSIVLKVLSRIIRQRQLGMHIIRGREVIMNCLPMILFLCRVNWINFYIKLSVYPWSNTELSRFMLNLVCCYFLEYVSSLLIRVLNYVHFSSSIISCLE